MNKTLKWILIGLALFFVAFFVAMPIIGMLTGYGFYGPGAMMGGRWDGGFGHMGLRTGGFGLGFIFPLALIALAVYGFVALLRRNHNTPVVPPTTVDCPHCGKPVHTGWLACPSCGEKL